MRALGCDLDLRGCRLQPEFEALLRGLFVNVVEHAGEGKYRTVSNVWVKGRVGGGRNESGVCHFKKKGKFLIGIPFLILSPPIFHFRDAKMRLEYYFTN